jgi:hypothetical protein
MIIKLSDIPTLWYGGIKESRRSSIIKTLNSLNLKHTHVEPVVMENGILGCKASAKKSLLVSINCDNPTLILEDDCAPTKWYTDTFSVPDDADALYLGTSIRGLTDDWMYKDYRTDPIWHGRPIVLEDYKDVYKINNMLTTHAILFITKRYKEYCYNILEYCVQDDLPCDVIYAAGMKKYNVYAVKRPVFYQDCESHFTVNDTITPLEGNI